MGKEWTTGGMTGQMVDGDLHVKVVDVVAWLRDVAEHWRDCIPAQPSAPVDYLADILRDEWIDVAAKTTDWWPER